MDRASEQGSRALTRRGFLGCAVGGAALAGGLAGRATAAELLPAGRDKPELPPRIPDAALLQHVWQLNMRPLGRLPLRPSGGDAASPRDCLTAGILSRRGPR